MHDVATEKYMSNHLTQVTHQHILIVMQTANDTFPLFIGRHPLTKVELWAYRQNEVAPLQKVLADAEAKAAQNIGRQSAAKVWVDVPCDCGGDCGVHHELREAV